MTITPRRGTAPARTQRGRSRRRPVRNAYQGVHPRHAAEPAAVAAPIPTTLPPLPRTHRKTGVRRAYLGAALLRCVLYLSPISVGVAGSTALSRVAWPVPLVTLLLGWTAAQALTCAGVAVARRAGIAVGCRFVAAGFGVTAGVWCALVWIAPDAMLGPQRGLALVVGLSGLATLATVTSALVTRSEAAVVRWSLPSVLLAGATLAELAGAPLPWLPVDTLLPASIVLMLVRAFRPAMLPDTPHRSFALTGTELRRSAFYLVIGAAQAICVVLLWRNGPSGSTVPFWLPLLLAVPVLEALIAWNLGQDGAERAAVTLVTVAGLLPPLAVGVTLWIGAYRMPATLAGLGLARPGALALAGGMLLGGVFAITYLLAARGRAGIAAALAAAPPAAVAVLKLLPVPAAGPLPNAVGALAVTHAAGLLIVAITAADHRRVP